MILHRLETAQWLIECSIMQILLAVGVLHKIRRIDSVQPEDTEIRATSSVWTIQGIIWTRTEIQKSLYYDNSITFVIIQMARQGSRPL